MQTPLLHLDIDLLHRNPFQPRRIFNGAKLDSLAASIKTSGLIQPIVARETVTGYEIIAGERRWRACQKAHLHQVPVIIRQCSDEESATAAIAENIEREDLSLLEMAYAFSRLSNEFSKTQKQIGELYSINEKNVTHILRLLTLDPFIQENIDKGQLTLGHAKVILSAPKEHRSDVARQIIKKELSVRGAEKIVKALIEPSPATTIRKKDPDLLRLEQQISEAVGLNNSIAYNEKGAGTVVFNFSSFEELEGLLQKLRIDCA